MYYFTQIPCCYASLDHGIDARGVDDEGEAGPEPFV